MCLGHRRPHVDRSSRLRGALHHRRRFRRRQGHRLAVRVPAVRGCRPRRRRPGVDRHEGAVQVGSGVDVIKLYSFIADDEA